jgi:5-methylcytosine-specific restriction endonuclease McrBC GTP-binding regulatory subunit McrB
MIPVRPDWNDSSELLGYFDLKGDYIPGQLVAPLLMAHAESEKPFFVCLDEMNLARVEHYFSDFLSIVESRRRTGTAIFTDPVLQLSQLQRMKVEGLRPEARKALVRFQNLGQPLGLPENLFVAGTVNMDETTQPFSRKVLDRAHTLEFNDIDLLQGLEEEAALTDVPPLDLDQSFFKPEFTSLADLLAQYRDTANTVAGFLDDLNDALSGGGFEVGYRVRDESISFAVYAEQAGLNADEVNEAIVLQKILPRIQGSSPRVEKVLLALLRHPNLKGDTTVPEDGDPNLGERLLELRNDEATTAVVRKIAGMLLIYREENFASFWLA